MEIGPIFPYMFPHMDMCDISLCIPVGTGRHFLKNFKISKKLGKFCHFEKIKVGLDSACCEKHKKQVFGKKIDPGVPENRSFLKKTRFSCFWRFF